MSAKLYKLIFDISICYTIGAFLLMGIAGLSVSGWGYLILLVFAGASMLLWKQRLLSLCILLILPIVLIAFLNPALPELIVYLLTWAYSSYVVGKDRMSISRGELLDLLKKIFLLFLLLLTVLLIAVVQHVPVALQTACPYFILVMVSAVCLLRHLRIDYQAEKIKGYHWQQLMEFSAFIAISLLLTLLRAPQMLIHGGKLLYLHLIEPVVAFLASLVGMLISGILYLILVLYRLITNSSGGRELIQRNEKGEQPLILPPDVTATDIRWILPFIYGAGIILCLILIFLFFRRLLGDKLKQQIPEDITETREMLADAFDKRAARRRGQPEDAREMIRYYYWRALTWLQHKKVDVSPQDTTEDIYYKYNQLSVQDDAEKREEAALLMKLYRNARYHKQEPILKEDALQAKKMYHLLTRSHKRK